MLIGVLQSSSCVKRGVYDVIEEVQRGIEKQTEGS